MKKWWTNSRFKFGVTIAILGGVLTAYVVKDRGRKPDAGVIHNGDTLISSTGDSIRTAPDTAKLNP